MSTVKQFIRNVRASKTIADERSVVQKESAAIRASFREESGDHNIRCVCGGMIDSGRQGAADTDTGGITLQSCYTFLRLGNGHTLAR